LDMEKETNSVKSISRAADILFCLSNGINTVTDIAKKCELSKSTVHRLLKALKESHLATQDPINQQYHLGPLITRLSSNPQTNHNYLITCSIEEMNGLWNIVEETVTLNIMIGIQYVRLHEIPSKHDLRVIERYDPVGPIYVGATAKVLLSQLNDEELKAAIKHIRISCVTEHSVTDKKILLAQSRKIRQQGYAISYGERIAGALCISAPIKNYFWPAALSIVGPEIRLKPRVNELVREVTARSSRITNNITDFYQGREVMNYGQMMGEKQAIENSERRDNKP
jgi:IclR family KDG regulon transcriptional repressor